MQNIFKHIFKSIAVISMMAMFFSCTNNATEVRNLFVDQNRPIGVAKNIKHVYKDSGHVINKTQTKLIYDFSNRKEHPYKEFPKGLKIVSINKNGKDSTSIEGNYAITYSKTNISEIKDNVVIINYTQGIKLETNQLFWDQKQAYYFTEEAFRLTTKNDTISGYGFESKQDLSKWVAKDVSGNIRVNQKQL